MNSRSKLRRRGVALALSVALAAASCENESSDPEGIPDGHAEILLEGRFRRVTKEASGMVQIRRLAGDYELVLRGVSLHAEPPVRVYILGLNEAHSTAAVDATDSKYDMGPLEVGADEQVISIPKPLDEMRSVVLWNPAFGINLASASLEPPPE